MKEKIVCAWTDNVRHLENTTTNRVESAHATLKKWSENSKGDLCRDWDSMNHIVHPKKTVDPPRNEFEEAYLDM